MPLACRMLRARRQVSEMCDNVPVKLLSLQPRQMISNEVRIAAMLFDLRQNMRPAIVDMIVPTIERSPDGFKSECLFLKFEPQSKPLD